MRCNLKKWFQELGGYLIGYTPKLCAILILMLIVVLFVIIVAHIIRPCIEDIYSNHNILVNMDKLTKQEYNSINYLISKNRIIPLTAVYSNTLSYYDTLISVLGEIIAGLVALLGIFAFVSWISLRNKIKNEIGDAIEALSESSLFASWIKENLDLIIERKIPDWLNDKEKLIDDVKEQVICNIERDKELKIHLDEEETVNGN